MKKFIKLPLLVFVGFFVLGLILFFPLYKVKYPLIAEVYKQTGADLQMGNIHIGTGLGLGLQKGSLFGVHAQNVMLTLPTGQSVRCVRLSVAPHLWTFFIGRLQLGLRCELDDGKDITAVFSASPFWNPQVAKVEVELKAFNLALVEKLLSINGLAGTLDGQVWITELSLGGRTRRPPNVKWEVSGRDIVTPAIANDFLNLPSLSLGPVTSKGSFGNNRLAIDPLDFGETKSPLFGQFKINYELDPMGLPKGGEWTGQLKTEANFEKTQLRDKINLDLIFGKVKEASGSREFKKPCNGNVITCFMGPPLDN